MDTVSYFDIFRGSVVAYTLLELYLLKRRSNATHRGLPSELKKVVTQEEYESARDYNRDKIGLGYVSQLYGLATTLGTVHYWPALWSVAGGFVEHWLWQPALFVLMQTLLDEVLGLPLSLYSTFVIEEKHGFNKLTARSYTVEKFKKLLLNLGLSVVMWAGFIPIVEFAGKNAWWYVWLFLSAFVFVFNMAYPVFIAPLFNKFTPLDEAVETLQAETAMAIKDHRTAADIGLQEVEGDEDEEEKIEAAHAALVEKKSGEADALKAVRDGITRLIAQTGLTVGGVFMIDGSKQSSHSNAYVAGMLSAKRVVIYDTLVKDLNSDVPMINAVVGHEIGHSVEHHTWALLGVTMANLFVMFFTFGLVQNTPEVVLSFGFESTTTFLSLNCFMVLYATTVMPLFGGLMNSFTRALEFRADAYSNKLGLDIRPALIGISKTNKGDLNPDWLHSLWHHNHPPLVERIDAVNVLRAKED